MNEQKEQTFSQFLMEYGQKCEDVYCDYKLYGNIDVDAAKEKLSELATSLTDAIIAKLNLAIKSSNADIVIDSVKNVLTTWKAVSKIHPLVMSEDFMFNTLWELKNNTLHLALMVIKIEQQEQEIIGLKES
jgi:hypothetical protein